MTEHVCDWVWSVGLYRCRDKACNKVMSTIGATHKLNEYETLKATTGKLKNIPCRCPSKDSHFTICAWWSLEKVGITYIDTLEGNDGQS